MARIDRTYSSADIIRFWCNNLDSREKNRVVLFFWIILPGMLLRINFLRVILDRMSEILPIRQLRTLTRIISILLRILEGVSPGAWTSLIFSDPETKRIVVQCIRDYRSTS